MSRSSTAIVFTGWLLLGAIVLGLLAPPDGEPGLNYDEAFLAPQARDFFEPQRYTTHPPSERSTYLLGRRFPLRNAAYLGALKPQLLIPAFALFGSNTHTLHRATLGTALLALLLATLWARRVFGLPTALLGALLVATDPGFVFFGTREWGPFTTLLLCRCAGLYLLTAGWQTRRGALVVAGALAMGLGVYARADFVLIGGAVVLGCVAARGPELLAEIRARPRTCAAALAALFIGALPMLLSMLDLFTVGSGIANRGDLAYRLRVLWSTLDGSYYYRVIDTGGLFDHIFSEPAPSGLLGPALVAAACLFVALLVRRRTKDREWRTGAVFLALTVLALGSAMVALPGSVRAHHMLNLMPFSHLLVAEAIVTVARSRLGRVGAGLILVAIVASNVQVVASTRDLIAETGGRGRYSNALDAFATELVADPSATVVSLDWGFHETFQFLTTRNRLVEPIWAIPQRLARRSPWKYRGGPDHHYVVFAPRYDLFGLGPDFLEMARAADPGDANIREHRDRQGEIVFYSVRFHVNHELVYGGRFSLRLLR